MPLRKALIVAAGVAAAAFAAAAPASARIIEVGATPQAAVPTCPSSPCLAVSRTTGYQTKAVDDREAFVIPRDGKIVAWSVSLGNPDRRQIAFFDDTYGASRARLSVLRRGTRLYGRVRTQSPVESLEPYFGQTVQFPLDSALDVKRGYIIALTVPTWAPALTQLLDDGSSWRASRPKGGCDDTERQTAQSRVGQLTQYRCRYNARLTYSATLITEPRTNAERKERRARRRSPDRRR